MVLGPFAKTKGPRLPGRNTAFIMIKMSDLLSQIRGGWGFDSVASERHQNFVGNEFADP